MTREEIVQAAFLEELAEIEKVSGVVGTALKTVSGAGKSLLKGGKELGQLARTPGQALSAGRDVYRAGAAGGKGVVGGLKSLHRAGATRQIGAGAAGAAGAYGTYRGAKRLIQGPKQPQPPQQPR